MSEPEGARDVQRESMRPPKTSGRLRWGLAVSIAVVTAGTAAASSLRIRDTLSPENPKRDLRAETRYIVLHTTEGRERGSLRKLRKRGEAHYFVHRDGRVARIIDRQRIATHAGLSMWAGRKDVDRFSLAIEVSGYHDKEPTQAQYAAVRELLRQLQKLYGIPDSRVLTHSMVAYGAPNRFHPHPHRGRKRCGMVFADPKVRRKLGLADAPDADPDVTAGRLRIGDSALHRHLYPARPPVRRARTDTAPSARATVQPASRVRQVEPSLSAGTISRKRTAWKIAGPAYAAPSTVYVFPDGARIRGDAIRQWSKIPSGTRVLLGQTDGEPKATSEMTVATGSQPEDGLLLLSQSIAARDLLGDAATASTTVYLLPSGAIRTGAELDASLEGRQRLKSLPARTRVLVGYVGAGTVSRGQTPKRVAGNVWNRPTTYYRVPSGALRTGAELARGRVPAGTVIFLRQ